MEAERLEQRHSCKSRVQVDIHCNATTLCDSSVDHVYDIFRHLADGGLLVLPGAQVPKMIWFMIKISTMS